ncbi:hypothetical protein KCTCHS21_01740 [Cohnella abietis]|uniref:Uncharacterized protein n=1 Tax=Cohnella abietis TaxID=2507935 RepID=A0A3T1CYF0_9BACL|nr:hypothetical protein KCTCHS21_01740 [Cohnella abietis]
MDKHLTVVPNNRHVTTVRTNVMGKAELDIRMSKVKQKIPDYFQTALGGKRIARFAGLFPLY